MAAAPLLLLGALAAGTLSAQVPAGQNTAADAPIGRAFLNKYCVTCHNEKLKTAGLTLDKLDFDRPGEQPEPWEKVIRKVRAGLMPPAGMPRAERAVAMNFLHGLEDNLDKVVAANPNPGATALHRMNRFEYKNAVRDLLDIEIDETTLLPADDSSEGFDNIADVLGVSPALLERYVAAASKVSRLAIGETTISPLMTSYRVREDVTQRDTLEGLPPGTRGGILIHHTFPVDANYLIKASLLKTAAGPVFGGLAKDERIEISIDGVRVALLDLGEDLEFRGGKMRTNPLEVKLPVKAGPHALGVAFLKRSQTLSEDSFQPAQGATSDISIGAQQEYTNVPHLQRVDITGPYETVGAGETPSRRKVFVCRPAKASDEIACAKKIAANLVKHAFRRPANDVDVEALMSFYQQARNKADHRDGFEAGIQMVLRRVLADPEFIFRFERDPALNGQTVTAAHRISDLELASRLSFFLWSSIPDDELLNLAAAGKLHEPAMLNAQVKRMLANAKASALVTSFAGQWLYLRQVQTSAPDARTFPDFDDNLRQGFKRETELLVESIIREDRNVMDLLNADYTFVNERLAKHYGIPGVYGTDFRRVPVTDDARRGLLGQGSVLLVTSTANRTSPVQRGKWVLENVLGSPAPLPPPNVPALKENADGSAPATVRERMEQHRANPVCAACHKLMDPIGFSLESFDAIGRFRTHDAGNKIDTSGLLVDGSKLNGPASLRAALMNYPDAFVGSMAEKLLMYALGRRLETYDMPVARAITREAAKNNYRFSTIVMGIVTSAPFQMRKPAGEANTVASLQRAARE
jgi:hypothetical protein